MPSFKIRTQNVTEADRRIVNPCPPLVGTRPIGMVALVKRDNRQDAYLFFFFDKFPALRCWEPLKCEIWPTSPR